MTSSGGGTSGSGVDRRRLGGVAVLLLALCLCPAWTAAQEEPVPLSRADVARLVTGDTYTEREKVSIVRRSCLRFRLTEADLSEFDRLGAPDSVLDALRSCRAPAPLEVILSVRDTSVSVEDTLTVVAFARRDGSPVPDLDLRLSADGARGLGEDAAIEAVTDDEGRARFRVPSETRPDSTVFRVVAPGAELRSRPELRLVTRRGRALERRSELARSLPATEDEVEDEVVAGRSGADRADTTVVGAEAEENGPALPEPDAGAEESGRREDAPPGRPTSGDLSSVIDTVATTGEPLPPPEDRREARRRLAASLRDVPGNLDALVDLGRFLRRADDLEASARALHAVVEHDRSAATAWLELGRTWARAGRTADARHALLRARDVADAGVDTSGLADDLAGVHGAVPGARVRALAGATLEGGGGGGLRWADVRVRAMPRVELTGRYERSLGRVTPVLTRGPAALEAFSLAGSVEWGEGGRYASSLEMARRRTPDPVEPALDQNVYRAEQTVRVASPRGSMRFTAGGLLGRWYDRDDWMIYGRADVPVTARVDLTSALHAGETVGSHFPAGRRIPAEEVRAHLGADVRAGSGVRVVPRLGLGDVDSDREELSGSLWELLVEVSVPAGERTGLEIFVHHQSPPGMDAFTVLAAGLQVAVR